MARCVGASCKRGLGMVRGVGAAKGVGFGPQIKFGATDPEVAWGLGAVLGEIPLFEPGAGSAASAGMTDLLGVGMTGLVARG